jgi:hypothetical protein
MNTLINKANELGKFPGFEVALIIRKRGKITTFQSIEDDSCWPTMVELVGVITINRVSN